MPFPSLGIFLTQASNPGLKKKTKNKNNNNKKNRSPALQAECLLSEPPWNFICHIFSSFLWLSNVTYFRKNTGLIDYSKAYDCLDYNKLWKILKGKGIPDHFTCSLRNLYTGQEATVRTGHGTTDWFKFGKGVSQGCVLSLLFNFYSEYIIRNAGLDEA